jgi:hypothetical protein
MMKNSVLITAECVHCKADMTNAVVECLREGKKGGKRAYVTKSFESDSIWARNRLADCIKFNIIQTSVGVQIGA